MPTGLHCLLVGGINLRNWNVQDAQNGLRRVHNVTLVPTSRRVASRQGERLRIATRFVASSGSQYNVQQTVEPENVQYNVYRRKMESTKAEESVLLLALSVLNQRFR